MTDEKKILLSEIRALHGLLKRRDKWYIETSQPEIELFEEIAEKAKSYSDKKLSRMSRRNLYRAYLEWEKEDHIMKPDDNYYMVFLNDIAWDFGLSALEGMEKQHYCDSINLKIKFNKP